MMEEYEAKLLEELDEDAVKRDKIQEEVSMVLEILEKLNEYFQCGCGEPIEVPQDAGEDELYELVDYLGCLLPTKAQIEAVIGGDVWSKEFSDAMRRVHRNALFCQQSGREELFGTLLTVYNYGADRAVKWLQQMIFEVTACSGIRLDREDMRALKLSAGKALARELGQHPGVRSVREFQVVRLLDTGLQRVIGLMREGRYQLFRIYFEDPYVYLLRRFYAANYRAFRVRIFTAARRQHTDSSLIAANFFIRLAGPLAPGEPAIFPAGYSTEVDVEFVRLNAPCIGFSFLTDLNARLAELGAAPFEVQVLPHYASREQLHLVTEVELHGPTHVYQEYHDAAGPLIALLAFVIANHQFETAIQEKVFVAPRNVETIFGDTLRPFKTDILAVIKRQPLRQEIYAYLIIKYAHVQLRAELSQCVFDQLVSVDEFELLQVTDDILAQLYNRISNAVALKLEALAAVSSDNLYRNYNNTLTTRGLKHLLTLPPYYFFSNLYLLVALFQIDNTIGIHLFQALQERIEHELDEYTALDGLDGGRFLVLVRSINSYYVMCQIFDYECSAFLLAEAQKRYTELLDEIKQQLAADNMTSKPQVVARLDTDPAIVIGGDNLRQIIDHCVHE